MSDIILLDTSVFLNILNVPGDNQKADEVRKEVISFSKGGHSLLLPLATILETGNHISDLSTGGDRFGFAEKLRDQVKKALTGDTPYVMTYFPDQKQFLSWLNDFPEYAKRNKSRERTREGISLSDLLIVKEWERTCGLHPARRVWIWSLDSDLSSYDRHPAGWLESQ